jgi:amino-acid N-acetyltransferase
MVRIRRATSEDLPQAKTLLSAAGLPIDDLTATHLAFVGIAGSDVVGVIGIENYGTVGLLRSLVVAEDARAAGLGRELVAALEASAHEQGVDEIWLLTTDADPFFRTARLSDSWPVVGAPGNPGDGRIYSIVSR